MLLDGTEVNPCASHQFNDSPDYQGKDENDSEHPTCSHENINEWAYLFLLDLFLRHYVAIIGDLRYIKVGNGECGTQPGRFCYNYNLVRIGKSLPEP